jgi:hypothetical protein
MRKPVLCFRALFTLFLKLKLCEIMGHAQFSTPKIFWGGFCCWALLASIGEDEILKMGSLLFK